MGREMTQAERDMFERFHAEETAKPMKYLQWETCFMDNDAIRVLRDAHGWEYVGYYVALCCILAKRKDHVYPIRTDAELYYLSHDMWVDVDTMRAILKVLVEVELIDAEMLERGKVFSRRVAKEATKQGDSIAPKRLGAWKKAHPNA